MKNKNYPFVELEMASLAIRKGYDKPTAGYYFTDVDEPIVCFSVVPYGPGTRGFKTKTTTTVPTYQELIDWFEEKHRLKILRIPFTSGKDRWVVWGWDTERVLWRPFSSDYEDKDTVIKEAFKLIP